MNGGDAAESDARFMRRAIELAERGRGRVAPNPLVGAVVVRAGHVVGEGWHAAFGEAHAEVEALTAAAGAARGATLYVTLEPCAHTGKTGPCTEAILAAGVSRVVFACEDPDPAAGGGGEVLRDAGLQVSSGVERSAARALNGPFFHRHSREAPPRPWTELKLALSLDGRIADREARAAWITGAEARAETHRLRAGHDAVAVGIGTALADDPNLTVRGREEPRIAPARIVFDRNARLPLDSRLVRTAREIPVWVVCLPGGDEMARRRLEAEGVRILEAVGLADALTALRSAGFNSVFCEGGARIASSLLAGGLVDRLTLFYAPLFLGPEAIDPFEGLESPPLAEAARWRLVRAEPLGNDTMISVER
ncbi:MAG: bifunctional diaminohydroxyphosphoribosylaminopyrimidine deaminase/5-amino-6-(5-phosphoribosylamino)uracil reductase RibD [Gemmatimonadota bacterium]